LAKFSRHHYEVLAQVIGKCPDDFTGEDTINWIINAMGDIFEEDNSRFSFEKWSRKIAEIANQRRQREIKIEIPV